MEGKKTARWEY